MRSSGNSAHGEALDIHAARPEEHRDLYEAFAEIVARGEGFPQDPAVALTYDDFSDYWLDHKSFVAVATVAGRLAGSYHLKPNFVGRGAHIANAGYFVVRGLRGHGIGERLVRHSMEQALALGFDAVAVQRRVRLQPRTEALRAARVPGHGLDPRRHRR